MTLQTLNKKGRPKGQHLPRPMASRGHSLYPSREVQDLVQGQTGGGTRHHQPDADGAGGGEIRAVVLQEHVHGLLDSAGRAHRARRLEARKDLFQNTKWRDIIAFIY